jgi:hypothetical protein
MHLSINAALTIAAAVVLIWAVPAAAQDGLATSDNETPPIGNELAHSGPPPQALPAGFRGKIVYDGNMEGIAKVADRSHQLNLNIGGVRLHDVPTVQVSVHGGLHIEVEFDGQGGMSGSYAITSDQRGVGRSASFRGQVTGAMCHGFDPNGKRQNFLCAADCYASNITFKDGGVWRLHATRTQLIDYVERDRLAVAALAKRQEDYQSYLNGLSASAKARAELFAQTLEIDSRAWISNRLDPYSVRNVVIQKRNNDGTLLIYGDYSLNNGSPGWMRAIVNGKTVQCVEFFDFPGTCREVGNPSSRGVASAVVAGILSSNNGASAGLVDCDGIETSRSYCKEEHTAAAAAQVQAQMRGEHP